MYLIPNKRGAPQEKKCGVPEPERTRLRVSWAPKTGTSAARYDGGLSPDRNSNNVPPIGTQTTDRTERGAQDPWFSSSVGTGG